MSCVINMLAIDGYVGIKNLIIVSLIWRMSKVEY